MKAAAVKFEPRMIAAGEFKAKCLQLIDEVHDGEINVIVTKRGKPMARLVPIEAEKKPFRSIVGRSPGIKTPSWTEWKRLKSELAAEWTEPAEKLARMERGTKKARTA